MLLVLLASAGVLAATPGAPTVWTEGPTEKVRPSAQPEAQRDVHLVGARNEFVSFQLALHGGASGLRGVRAQLEGLTGPDTITAPDVTLYREELITTRRPSVPEAEVGPWPDPLVPDVDEIGGEVRRAFPFDVPAGETRALWVDVRVPEDAAVGEYHGEVQLTGEGFSEVVPVRLTVVDATLPSTPSLATAFLLWPPHVCLAHTGSETCGSPEEEVALLSAYHRMALEHRISLSSAFPRTPGPTDWAAFDAEWAPFLDGTAQTRLPGARVTSVQYVGEPTAEGLADFARHFAERGWLTRAYDYVGDEPPFGTTWEDVASRVALTRSAAPGLRTLLTTTAQEVEAHGLAEQVDVLAPLINHFEGTEPPYEGNQRATYEGLRSRPGAELWLYQSCMSHGCAYGTNAPENRPGAGWPSYMLDRSGAKARAMEWLTFLGGGTGELYYQTVGMLASAWEDQFRFNGNGDGTLFYPGTPATIGGMSHVPVASLRLKLIRQGVQDYEWLELVSDAGDPEFAREVARELIPAASQVPDDGDAFDAARLRLVARYLELTGQPPLR